MERRGLLKEEMHTVLDMCDPPREDDGDTLILPRRVDGGGHEGLARPLLQVDDLTDRGAITLDPIDEEDMGLDMQRIVVVTSVYGVFGEPVEVLGREVFDDGGIPVEAEVKTLTHEGRVAGLHQDAVLCCDGRGGLGRRLSLTTCS